MAIYSGVLAAALGIASVGGVDAEAAAHADAAKNNPRPLIKSMTYTPLKTKEEDGFLQARVTATVKLSKPAPSIYFEVTSTSSKNVEEQIGPEPSYGTGVHKISFTTTALPGGTYKLTLYAYVKPPKDSGESAKTLKGSNPATLVVEEATETEAGTGKVTKL